MDSKIFLVIFIISVQAVFSDVDPLLDITKAEGNCLDDFPTITMDLLEEIKRNRKFPDDTSRDLKCFVHCVGKSLEKGNCRQFWGLNTRLTVVLGSDNRPIDDNGVFHVEGLKLLTMHITDDVEHDDAHGIVSKCTLVDDPDLCEKAFQYASCKLDELKSYTFTKDFCTTC